MSIYDKTKMMCRTWIESVNNLFKMGKDLETEVDGMKGGIVKDVTLTEVDKHYTLTILYDDDTSDTVTWDDSTVGIEDITLTYSDGTYILTVILTDGTRYTFSIPVGNVVTEEELTALNLGTPDDEASSTGSLWARVKNAIVRIGIIESNDITLNGTKTFVKSPIIPDTPESEHSAINQNWVENVSYEDDTVNNLLHKDSKETITEVKTVKLLHPDEHSNIYTLLGGFNGISVEDDRLTDRTSNPSVDISRALTRLVELNGNLGYSTITTNINANGNRYMRMQLHTGTKFIEISVRHDGATGDDYGYCPQRITSSTSLSGTTYDNDIVTIKTLKELGLIQ